VNYVTPEQLTAIQQYDTCAVLNRALQLLRILTKLPDSVPLRGMCMSRLCKASVALVWSRMAQCVTSRRSKRWDLRSTREVCRLPMLTNTWWITTSRSISMALAFALAIYCTRIETG
jgi:hypothetical protein